MAKSNVTRKKSKNPAKPAKPYPGFPMTPHPTGRWCKKIRGKLHYFGPWDDPDGALENLNRELPFLKDGRTPPPDGSDGCTILTLANSFLTSKRLSLTTGELSERSFRDYYKTCELVIGHLGKTRRVDDLRPDDFESLRAKLAANRGMVTLKNEINRCRVLFKFAHDQRLIDRPVAYGQSFNRPSAKMIRRARNERGQRIFEADELRRILDAADPILRAMVLLGINAGFGNSDIAKLPQSAVDLDGGWIEFPRPKTEIERRVPLWAETVSALREAVRLRPDAKDDADGDLCFLTVHGNAWVRIKTTHQADGTERIVPLDALSQKFKKLLKGLDINGNRGFYSLRHGFETIGGESRDQVVVNSLMGHVDSSMAGVYRHGVSDDRLRAVVGVVHGWLWPAADGENDRTH